MSQTKAELIDGKGDVVFDTDTLAVDATNNRVGIGEVAPGTQVEVNGAEPYITIKNSTEEDTDGGRESRIIFEGEQSGGEISTLAQIEVSHDGAVDDQKGKIVISTNDGTDGAAPTTALTISADQTVAVANNLTVNGNQYPTDGPLSNRNLIVNGAMQVAQRSTSLVSVSNNSNEDYQSVDRMRTQLTNSAPGAADIGQSTDVPAGQGFSNSWSLDVTTANTAPGTVFEIYVSQKLEAQDVRNSGWDYTDPNSFLTLSFWAKSNKAGTHVINITTHDGTTHHIPFEYDLVANTWTFVEKHIPGNANLTINNDNGPGFEVAWKFLQGTDRNGGTDETWSSNTQHRGTPNGVNLFDTVGNNFFLTGVQLEVGSKSTPFEHRSYADELHRCMRYYQEYTSSTNGLGIAGAGFVETGTQTEFVFHLSTPMRTLASANITEIGDLEVRVGGSRFDVTGLDSVAFNDNFSLAVTRVSNVNSSASVGTVARLRSNGVGAGFSFNAEL